MSENRPKIRRAVRSAVKAPAARLALLRRRLPRYRLGKVDGKRPRNPFFASAGGSAVGGPLPGGRATRGLTWLVILALLLLSGRWYYGQRVNFSGQVERVVRAEFLPKLEKEIGQPVEVGRIETDWLGRVVVHDLVIGRDANLPTGALGRARSITVGVDLPGLVLHRNDPLAAIHSVAIDSPEFYVRRDKTGLNWSHLLRRHTPTQKVNWTGRVTVQNGRIYYLDTIQKSASGRPLLLDARAIGVTVDAVKGQPYRFVSLIGEPYWGQKAQKLNGIGGQGMVGNDLKQALVSVDTTALPLQLLGDFAFPKRDVTVRGGTTGGSVQLVYDAGQITPRGQLNVDGAALTLNNVREPNSKNPIQIDAVSGPVAFAGLAFSTTGTTLRTLDSDWKINGAASIEKGSPPVFDLTVASPNLPVARLKNFLPASAPKVGFSTGATKLDVHLSGTQQQISATGSLDTVGTLVDDPNSGAKAQLVALHTVFVADASGAVKNLDWRVAARFSSPGAQGQAPQGSFSANNLTGTARAVKNGAVEVDLGSGGWKALSPRYGASGGHSLHLTASTPSLTRPDWRGSATVKGATTGGLRFTAFSPSLGKAVEKSGDLDVSANFSGLNGKIDPSQLNSLKAAATFSLSGVALNPKAFGKSAAALPLQSSDFSVSDLRGRVALSGGRVSLTRASAVSSFGLVRLDADLPLKAPKEARIALTLPNVAVPAARFAPFLRAQNVALDGDWRGRVSLLSQAGASGRFGLDFDIATPSSELRGLGNRGAHIELKAPRLQGRADLDINDPANLWKGGATLVADSARIQSGTLGRFAALPAQISGARAVGLRLNLAASALGKKSSSASVQLPPPAPQPGMTLPLRWTAQVSAQRISAPVAVKGRPTAFVTLTNANGWLQPLTGGLQVTRVEASFGGGKVTGTASLQGKRATAHLLASDVNLGGAQRLLAPETLKMARLTGNADATVDVEPDGVPTAEVRMAQGAVVVPQTGSLTPIPIENAQAHVEASGSGRIVIRDARAWSDGLRVAADATLVPTLWSGNVEVSGARLARFAAFPQLARLPKQAAPDGLASGSFSFQVDPKNLRHAQVTGRADLKLATVFGAHIEEVGTQIAAENGANGWRIALSGINGKAEGAPFGGEVMADSKANSWQVKLKTQQLDSLNIARLRALFARKDGESREASLERALPIGGEVTADIDLVGTLNAADGHLDPKRATVS